MINKLSSFFKTLGSVALVAVILACTSSSLLALTTLTVTLSTDNNPGGIGEAGDLRSALNTMNQGLNTTLDDYAIVFSSSMTIQLNGILPLINNSASAANITIGNSSPAPASRVTIDGNSGAYPGFFIAMGNVTIQNMTLQNMAAKGGNGGNGISGGGGGMGAGGAIYAPQTFLNGSNPSITLINVAINNCSAVGGNGGSYFSISSPSGNEGGGGGGGFGGNGASITTTGSTGGAGGGGFGGNGGDVTLSTDTLGGGGGGGGGGLGSRATIAPLTNLGNGGSDQDGGQKGNGYGLTITAGFGGGGNAGGIDAGGGGGGGSMVESGGGGGGSAGQNGTNPQGAIAPWDGVAFPKTPALQRSNAPITSHGTAGLSRHSFQATAELANQENVTGHGTAGLANYGPGTAGLANYGPTPNGAAAEPSGGNGGDGGGGGGGGVVITSSTNEIDGQAAGGGYGGGGGGGAGTGAYDTLYTVQGGSGGIGGGGGGGGANESGETPAGGGSSLGGGGGAGGGPSNGTTASGGTDVGNLGGGSGGTGANTVGPGSGGGGGGGGSGLGGAIFLDSNLSLIVQAIPGTPTTFNTANNTTVAGTHGTGGGGGSDGTDGSPFGNSIFLRAGSSVTFLAQNTGDLLTLGTGVQFADDTAFGAGGTSVLVTGNGTVVYNGTTGYQGLVKVNNATFDVNGEIDAASIYVCRNLSVSQQRGTLSGIGILTGDVFVNSGTIFPNAGKTLTLGSLTLNPANPSDNTLGSLVEITINSSGTSLVSVTGPASLAGMLKVDLAANAQPGSYKILTSSAITGTFDSVVFSGATPNYSLSYLPAGNPTYVQFDLLPPSHLGTANGSGTISTHNNQASFSFNISDNNKKGTPSGTLTYTDVKGGIKLTSTAITAITLTQNQAKFSGKGTIANSNPKKKPIPVSFTVIAVDNGTPGAPKDTFTIQISSPYYATGNLTSGNIVVH